MKELINIISCNDCAVPVDDIESVVSVETFAAMQNKPGLFVLDLVPDKTKIKAYVILKNGNVYPSTFNPATILKRASRSVSEK